jgi:hypothetical protein
MRAAASRRLGLSRELGERDAEEFAALHDNRLFKFSGIAQNLSNSPVEPDAIEGRVVLDNVSKQIRECLEHAEECVQKAAELPNGSPFRQDFLQLEKRWLELARSIEFGEQLDSFTKNSLKPNIKPNVLH